MAASRPDLERGFSVIEALVALGIIATGVLAMAALAVRTTEMVARARQRSIASHLADAMLSELAARGVAPSGPGCLLSDVAGCVEYRNRTGRPAPSAASGYALRWYAAAASGSPLPATVLTVCAVPESESGARQPPGGSVRHAST